MVFFPATLYKIQNRHNEHNAGTLSNRNYCCISVRGHWVHIDLLKDWDRGLGRGLGRDLVLWRTTHTHTKYKTQQKSKKHTVSHPIWGISRAIQSLVQFHHLSAAPFFFFFLFTIHFRNLPGVDPSENKISLDRSHDTTPPAPDLTLSSHSTNF